MERKAMTVDETDRAIIERMQTDGVSPAGGTPEELRAQVTKEIEQWRQVVTRAGIRIN